MEVPISKHQAPEKSQAPIPLAFIRRCCACGRVLGGKCASTGRMFPIGELVDWAIEARGNTTDGYCEGCFEKFCAEVERERGTSVPANEREAA